MWPFKKKAQAEKPVECRILGVVHVKRIGKPCRIFTQCACGKYHLVRKQGTE